jgi:gliding motility-associated-like protein
MKRSVFFLLVIFVFSAATAVAQTNTNNIWFFGFSAGLDFNSGSPVALGGGQLATTEGCATVCDNSGQLLFYTDGLTVWNRMHSIMPNGMGLFGNGSSTQSAVICPDPASANRYYIFTADQGGYMGPNLGINYSIVDMTMAAGLGDVSVINQPLMAPEATEKIVAVRHCNGTDFWIIVHQFNNNVFHAYQLSATGVNPVPVISAVGTPHLNNSGGFGETIGYMKASPDGKKLALATYTQQFVEHFDFDNATGVISNPGTITYPGSGSGSDGPYGVSFSPDNTKLYVAYFDGGPPSMLLQYDMMAGSAAAIAASEFVVASSIGIDSYAGLQVGPDNKLYVSRFGATFIDVINSPNLAGAACGYVSNAVTLSPGATATGGFPNVIDAIQPGGPIAGLGADTVLCGPGSVTLDASGMGGGTYLWSTGATTPTITVTQSGTYFVSVTGAVCAGAMVDTINVTFLQNSISLGPDILSCDASVTLDPQVAGASYLWNTGETSQAISVNLPGQYWVRVTSGPCSFSDTINVDFGTGAEFMAVNVFTPNGDLSNDHFRVGQMPPELYSLEVYDRWGKLVFQASDPAQSWDGRFEGKDASEGVYYWVARYTDCKGTQERKTGFVELLR